MGDELSDVIFVVNGTTIAGAVGGPRAYAVRSVDNGRVAIRQLEPSVRPTLRDEVVPYRAVPARRGPTPMQPIRLPDPMRDARRVPAEDGSRIDLLVVYTERRRRSLGGADATRAAVDLAVTGTNQAYAHSGVVQRINLVPRPRS